MTKASLSKSDEKLDISVKASILIVYSSEYEIMKYFDKRSCVENLTSK
jgi:hypothetical protein